MIVMIRFFTVNSVIMYYGKKRLLLAPCRLSYSLSTQGHVTSLSYGVQVDDVRSVSSGSPGRPWPTVHRGGTHQVVGPSLSVRRMCGSLVSRLDPSVRTLSIRKCLSLVTLDFPLVDIIKNLKVLWNIYLVYVILRVSNSPDECTHLDTLVDLVLYPWRQWGLSKA